PEDLRALVRRYQETVAHAVERFHGYIAQYLGDGVLVYFGYPHAHDDDARRAVYAAHDVLGRLPELNAALQVDFGVAVSLRIGIHTGLVVVGDVGAGERHEALALGEVPNVAARLQSVAEPGQISLSEQTRELLGGQFDLDDLGMKTLKGLPAPVPVYRSVRPSGVASAFDLAVKHKLLPLAGRRDELAQLESAWARARDGHGTAMLVSGDPGIGKSRLIQALKDRLLDRDERWTALRASAYHSNTPLYPVIALLRQTIGIDERDSDAVNFMRIKASLEDLDAGGANVAGLIATLCDVGLPESAPPKVELARASAIFADLFMQFLLRDPRLLVIEDLHWLDPTTLALARGMIEQAPDKALLVVVSARPGFDLSRLVDDPSSVTHIRLGPLPRGDVDDMIRSVADDRRLADDVLDAIAERTDGVPAFVEELSRMLLGSDWLVARDGVLVPDGPLPRDVPVTLTDSLMARLDRLGDAKAVAQEAAVLGRTFSGAVLSAVSQFDAARLDRALHALDAAQVVRRRTRIGEDNWRFRHALLQEAAYESLLKARRQALHLDIANTLEQQFPTLTAQQPERVAQHFQLGNDAEHALGYWQWAAEQAVEQGGAAEALSHIDEALALLDALPESELRDQRELSLLSIKGSALVLRYGWAADGLAAIYDRAMALISRDSTGTHVDFQVLGGLCAFHLLRGEFDTVNLLTERLMQQGNATGDHASLTVAHVCRCLGGFFGGRFDDARREAESVTRHYDPDQNVPVSFLYGQALLELAHLVQQPGVPGVGPHPAEPTRQTLRHVGHPGAHRQGLFTVALRIGH
ncbi:MAG: AAA family ATPase, partial [Pseudomonadota bacterium]